MHYFPFTFNIPLKIFPMILKVWRTNLNSKFKVSPSFNFQLCGDFVISELSHPSEVQYAVRAYQTSFVWQSLNRAHKRGIWHKAKKKCPDLGYFSSVWMGLMFACSHCCWIRDVTDVKDWGGRKEDPTFSPGIRERYKNLPRHSATRVRFRWYSRFGKFPSEFGTSYQAR